MPYILKINGNQHQYYCFSVSFTGPVPQRTGVLQREASERAGYAVCWSASWSVLPVLSHKCLQAYYLEQHRTWNQILNREKRSKGITSVETTMHAFCRAWNIPNKCSLVRCRDYGGRPLSNRLRAGIMVTFVQFRSSRLMSDIWTVKYRAEQ